MLHQSCSESHTVEFVRVSRRGELVAERAFFVFFSALTPRLLVPILSTHGCNPPVRDHKS